MTRVAGREPARAALGRAEPMVAVLGNPNAGKSTIFNRLTGLSQKVGNYPGVTVEKKEGFFRSGGTTVRVIDLPGTYSLSAHSPDEMVAVDVLLGHQAGERRPDVVLHVADASNLERNLYLYTQLRELGLRVVVVLNMIDIAARRGMEIDVELLRERLGVSVVVTQGQRGTGVAELKEALVAACEAEPVDGECTPVIAGELADEVKALHAELAETARRDRGYALHRFEVLRALVDRGGRAEQRLARLVGDGVLERLEAERSRLGGAHRLAAMEAHARYAWLRERLAGCVRSPSDERTTVSERLDRVLTHRFVGVAIFAAVMLLLFQSIFSWAAPLMDLIDGAVSMLGSAVGSVLPDGVLRSLLVDGVIGGVGAVVIFLPQILLLFLFIGILEDCGYMARAAYLMDRVMARCGLSGKSFIPMLSGFACAVPGIMATRVIDERRDRIATILVTPLMSCSARLPVYTILIGTFIPQQAVLGGVLGTQALTMFALYLLGVVTAIAVAWTLKKTLLRGGTPPFLMELPSYKWPSVRDVVLRLYDRGRAFLLRAGTIILAVSVLIWALAYFPHPADIAERYEAERAALAEAGTSAEEASERLAELEQAEAGEYLRQSFFGRAGRAVEPVFRPLGWDWKISMAAIASFPAREIVVSTLGTIYNLGDETDETSEQLRQRLRDEVDPETGEPVFNVPVALSIMVFFALCCQCAATLATIKRETNSWGWAWLTFVYMTALAWVASLIVYQVGNLFA